MSVRLGWALLCLGLLWSAAPSWAGVTININGQEFYSDKKGVSEIPRQKMPGNLTVRVNGKIPDWLSGAKPSAEVKRPSRPSRRSYERLVAKIARRRNLDPELLHAIIQAESGYDPNAVSPAGAVGLMQLMPATAWRFGVNDPYDPAQNLNGGAGYLKYLLELFDSDLMLVVAAYNAGEEAVIRNHYRVPPFRETQRYVDIVLSSYLGAEQGGDSKPNARGARSGR